MLCKVPEWMKHKLESRLPGEISITSNMQMTPPFCRKWSRTKELLDESERGEWKSWLKLNIQKTKIMPSGTSRRGPIKTVTDFILLGSQITADGDLLLVRKLMTKQDSILKNGDITLPTKVCIRSVAQSCPTLCDPMIHSTPGLPVHHQLPDFTETHVHRVSDAIQPSHPLSSPSPPAPNPSQHQSLFQWVNSSHEVSKGLEFQL